jgi:hypothetical protein
MGSMAFDDEGFCAEIYSVLKYRVGYSIKEIGDLDLSYTFNPASNTLLPHYHQGRLRIGSRARHDRRENQRARNYGPARAPVRGRIIDLMEALKESMRTVQRGGKANRGKTPESLNRTTRRGLRKTSRLS